MEDVVSWTFYKAAEASAQDLKRKKEGRFTSFLSREKHGLDVERNEVDSVETEAPSSTSQLTLADIRGPLEPVDNEPDNFTRAELQERARLYASDDKIMRKSQPMLRVKDIAGPRTIPSPLPDQFTKIEMNHWVVAGVFGPVPATLPLTPLVGATLGTSQESEPTTASHTYLATRTVFSLWVTMAVFLVVALFHELSTEGATLSYLIYAFFIVLALRLTRSWHRMVKARYPLSSNDDFRDDGLVKIISSAARVFLERSRK